MSRDMRIAGATVCRVSKARLVIAAVVLEGRTQGDVARSYGVSQGWIRRLVTRYRDDSEAAQVSLFLVGEAGAAGRVLGVTAPR